MYNTASDTDYTDLLSLIGGNNKMLYNSFAIRQDGNLTGGLVLNNGALSLTK
jgi:hypothetical protein